MEVNGREVDHSDVNSFELGFKEGDLVVIKRPGKGGSSKRSRVWNATIVSENVPKPTSNLRDRPKQQMIDSKLTKASSLGDEPKQQKNDSKSSQRIANTYVKKTKR